MGIYIYTSHIYLARRPRRPVIGVPPALGARAAHSYLSCPAIPNPLFLPISLRPLRPLSVSPFRFSSCVRLLPSLCSALCRPPGAPARLPLRLRFRSPLSCVSAPRFLFFLFLCLSVPRLDAQSRSRPSNGLVVTVYIYIYLYLYILYMYIFVLTRHVSVYLSIYLYLYIHIYLYIICVHIFLYYT